HFLNEETKIRPAVILRSVFLKPGDRYSRKDHSMTLNRLMTMGTYKFVRVKFTPFDSLGSDRLRMLIYLTPMPKRTVRAEANVISKSNDFVGPQLNVNYRNRNTLNGAELLNMTLGGSFETQISGRYKNLYSYSFNPQIELYVPRFLTPFRVRTQSMYVPKTRLMLGYGYLRRVGFFDLRSIQFVYGYKWKQNAKTEHELDPISINSTAILKRTPEFNALLESNPFVQKSYEEQFIAGSRYSFIYNEQVIQAQRNQFYCNITTEITGNAFSAIKQLGGEQPSEEHPSKVIGSVYSQFFRIGGDFRNYSNFKKSKVVLRLYGGLGKAYGNSSTLPYIKQFFSGGPNSIRAFPINSLGPGTYLQQNTAAGLFLQQGGDIKLESNAEYRFDIFRFLKGAVFTDAGNVWLIRSDPVAVSQPFSYNTFYREIAVGAGVGLRIDLSFFVLRFDLAMPLRKPWLPENERWVLNKIDFGDGAWRGNNLVMNVAIGYPF
ncbi:MAG: translocation and assembly module lipoprotein TamL, partial [Bacteroidia bacterium]